MAEYEELLRVAEIDKVGRKAYGLEAVGNLAQYYVNVKADKEKGIYYLTKGLEFDPTNTGFKSNLDVLKRPASAVKPTNKTPVKTKTKTAAGKTKTKKKD